MHAEERVKRLPARSMEAADRRTEAVRAAPREEEFTQY
jgi:plasmid maintenance system killer protein